MKDLLESFELKRLEELADTSKWVKASHEELQDLARIVLEVKKGEEWVPCSEKMPLDKLDEEILQNVDVLVTDGISVGICECQGGCLPYPWVAFSHYGDIDADKITHWMPLPSPPIVRD